MIISASYKTDIPTFYGAWFMNRLRAGHCMMSNPYNRRPIRVSLQRPDVDGFIFWTKNISPFLPHLEEIHQRRFPFIIQHTINAYPRTLEHSVVDANTSIQNLHQIADQFGPRTCVWRYDTIVETSLTSFDWHRENFARLASMLRGAVDEVVISFAHFYRKTIRNITNAAREFTFQWTDPTDDQKRQLVQDLVIIARANSLRLSICSQRNYLAPGAEDAKCIDADRLQSISEAAFRAAFKGNRKECGCFASRDIGEYDTCPHGCVYCYAVQNQPLAQSRFRSHDPESEFLFTEINEGEQRGQNLMGGVKQRGRRI